jgi:hypothetical protein
MASGSTGISYVRVKRTKIYRQAPSRGRRWVRDKLLGFQMAPFLLIETARGETVQAAQRQVKCHALSRARGTNWELRRVSDQRRGTSKAQSSKRLRAASRQQESPRTPSIHGMEWHGMTWQYHDKGDALLLQTAARKSGSDLPNGVAANDAAKARNHDETSTLFFRTTAYASSPGWWCASPRCDAASHHTEPGPPRPLLLASEISVGVAKLMIPRKQGSRLGTSAKRCVPLDPS